MKRYLIILFLGGALSSSAQSTEAVQKAFLESYKHEQAQEFTAAIKDLTAVYGATSYEVNVRLGWLSYNAGDYPQALKYYKTAMKLMPYSIEAKLGYALPLAAMGNWNEVVDVYKQILATDAQNTVANYRLGSIYYERAQYEKAKAHTEKVVNLFPFDYDSVILLAWINLQMKDYRKAKILFNKSLLIRPGNQSAREGLKLIQYKKRAALDDPHKATKRGCYLVFLLILNPIEVPIMVPFLLGTTYTFTGMFK